MLLVRKFNAICYFWNAVINRPASFLYVTTLPSLVCSVGTRWLHTPGQALINISKRRIHWHCRTAGSMRGGVCVRVRWIERWRGIAVENGNGSVAAFFVASLSNSKMQTFHFHVLCCSLALKVFRKGYKPDSCQKLRSSPIFVSFHNFFRLFAEKSTLVKHGFNWYVSSRAGASPDRLNRALSDRLPYIVHEE